jgi:hypothetical protein
MQGNGDTRGRDRIALVDANDLTGNTEGELCGDGRDAEADQPRDKGGKTTA